MGRYFYFLAVLTLVGFGDRAWGMDWRYGVVGAVVRCFETKSVQVYCEDYTENHSPILNQELQIEAVDLMSRKFSYGYSRVIEGGLCLEHLKKISKLLKRADQVCVTGYGEAILEDGEIYARWDSLETKRGKVVW